MSRIQMTSQRYFYSSGETGEMNSYNTSERQKNKGSTMIPVKRAVPFIGIVVFMTVLLVCTRNIKLTLKYSSHPVPQETNSSSSQNNVTVVTAYFNLGSFRKGSQQTFGPNLYYKWFEVFRYIVNPLVIYTDCEVFATLAKRIRQQLDDRTEIILIERNSTWSFNITDRIRKVYSRPGYPSHHPNTVIPEYSSAMHVKYELTAKTARSNPFHTNYFAWLDIGYFRDIVNSKQFFKLDVPFGLKENRVAFNLIENIAPNKTPEEIIRQNLVWVGGGFVIGKADAIMNFEKDYKKAIFYLLDRNLMSTDQQQKKKKIQKKCSNRGERSETHNRTYQTNRRKNKNTRRVGILEV
ncbi:hypothetical protein ScPMuIL_009840 [Solemya velum]